MSTKHRDRLDAMASDNGETWDLSENDKSSICWALSQISDRERLLYALGHDKFRALRNYGDRWGISHLSHDGVSIKEMFNAHLDQLLENWCDVLVGLEIDDPLTGERAT